MKLIVGAFPPELGSWIQKPPRGWEARVVGIGGLEAALNMPQLLDSIQPTHVLFMGTCGVFDASKFPLGSFVEVRSAVVRNFGEQQGHVFNLPNIVSNWTASFLLNKHPLVTAVAPAAITLTHLAAQELMLHGDVENLEVASIFAACHKAGVPVGACLAISNEVNEQGHAQWLECHDRVMKELRDNLEIQLSKT